MSALPFSEWSLPSKIFIGSLGVGIISQILLERDLKSHNALPQWKLWQSNVGHLRRCLQTHKTLFPKSPLRILCIASLGLCLASLLIQFVLA
ncbi:hypothetical protein EDE15_0399 [Edaphobacter aggregans]|uniref:Uncharacterized protein n=1 Tax=Edaphobacter aggregans TaxID=570835 RepID=A0A428MDH7_9BACT|nr:hypothetical protein EDE15_0399 [Edaphobacter aggregans]